ncbi:hypothetical protein TNCT_592081 [Trichonephila clavata]|uniref:Uncharacterized protein n=1 Tax=Trichonephila clavata TaxID=2740835 RepID=A0A8X6GVN5_TRICU|nr:hypothetical protein TNCT_592081 [Trichonephila clavata]
MRSEVVSRDPVFLANGSGGLLGEVQANLSDDRLRKVERPLRYLSQVRLLALRCGFSNSVIKIMMMMSRKEHEMVSTIDSETALDVDRFLTEPHLFL